MQHSIEVENLLEVVADIAYSAGHHRYYSGDSRADMKEFIALAKEFNKTHSETDWNDVDYMTTIDEFVTRELKLKEKLMLNYPAAFESPWDNLEVERCREDGDSTYPIHDEEESVQPNDFWSVYVHQEEGGLRCIADVPTEKDANDLVEMISKAVRTFKDNGYLALYNNKSLQEKLNKLVDDRILNAHSDLQKSGYTALKTQINKLFI